MKYTILLLYALGISYSAYGASSDDTRVGFESEAMASTPKSHISVGFIDTEAVARKVSSAMGDPMERCIEVAKEMAAREREKEAVKRAPKRARETEDPREIAARAREIVLAIERSTPEGYIKWIHRTAADKARFIHSDDGLGVDNSGRSLEAIEQEKARRFFRDEARKAKAVIEAKKEAYKHRILYAAWQAAEARKAAEEAARKKAAEAVAYRQKILYAAWLRAQNRPSTH